MLEFKVPNLTVTRTNHGVKQMVHTYADGIKIKQSWFRAFLTTNGSASHGQIYLHTESEVLFD